MSVIGIIFLVFSNKNIQESGFASVVDRWVFLDRD